LPSWLNITDAGDRRQIAEVAADMMRDPVILSDENVTVPARLVQ